MDAPLSSARHNRQEAQPQEKRRDKEHKSSRRDRSRSRSRRRRSRSRSRRSRSRDRRRDEGGRHKHRDGERRRDDGERRRDDGGFRRDDGPRPAWGGDTDANLPHLKDDPREQGPLGKAQRAALGLGVATGRNTESFDPKSTLVRPAFRIRVCSGSKPKYDKQLKHDDVVIVPEFFCSEDDWSLYYKLIDEMRESQQRGKPQGKRGAGPEWQSWHEGAHLISKDPSGSKTYQEVQKKMGDFFGLAPQSRGTRFNWYNNPSDWKPFHHDSAAFNPQRARNQNCTVGVSFGDARELAFVDANDPSKRFYFPQTNGAPRRPWTLDATSLLLDGVEGDARLTFHHTQAVSSTSGETSTSASSTASTCCRRPNAPEKGAFRLSSGGRPKF